MSLNDDVCPTFPPCPGCGARLCAECGDDYRETATGYTCGDCADEGEAA